MNERRSAYASLLAMVFGSIAVLCILLPFLWSGGCSTSHPPINDFVAVVRTGALDPTDVRLLPDGSRIQFAAELDQAERACGVATVSSWIGAYPAAGRLYTVSRYGVLQLRARLPHAAITPDGWSIVDSCREVPGNAVHLSVRPGPICVDAQWEIPREQYQLLDDQPLPASDLDLRLKWSLPHDE